MTDITIFLETEQQFTIELEQLDSIYTGKVEWDDKPDFLTLYSNAKEQTYEKDR